MCGFKLEIRSPQYSTSPDVVGVKDEIILKSVDFPAPLGPITDKISFSDTSKLMSLLAVKPPYFLVIFLTWMRAFIYHSLCQI